MVDKLQNSFWKTIIPAIITALSYLIVGCFKISELIFNFSDSIHNTVSLGIYSAALNWGYLKLLSMRTSIEIKVMDAVDESYNINITDRPRSIKVVIDISGNLKNIEQDIVIEIPEWVDGQIRSLPDVLREDKKFKVKLNNIETNSSTIDFIIDINVNPLYKESGRIQDIHVDFTGSKFRFAVLKKVAKVRYYEK